MTKNKHRFISLLLAAAMILSLLPAGAFAAETVDSGTCGENVTWTLDSDGLLTISGTGEISQASYPNSVVSVIIGNGVTGIGYGAFDGCSGLTSVTIGNGVTGIGDWAFSGCSGLTSVTIPDSVTSIGGGAFSHCSGLAGISIPGSVTSIGDNAFEGCSGLTSVTIPDSITSIGGWAFRGCSGLTSVTIPDSVTSIGEYAFFGCSGLTGVTIPNSVTSIEFGTFHGCSGLTGVTIPDGVTSIGGYAFSYCSGLTSVTIPDSVTSIGYKTFYDCSGLTSVTIGNGVTSIGGSAFSGCTGLTSVTIPDSVTSIGDSAFYGCSGLTGISVSSGNTRYNISSGNCLIEKDTKTLLLGFNNSVIPTDGSVTSIGNGAFASRSGLTSVTIPDSVTSIGDNAFEGCSGLTSVTIPDSVTDIGHWAFYECSGLTGVTIPDSVTSIGEHAFQNCESLTSVTIGNSVTSIGDDAFRDCSSLTSVTIPDSVTSIGIFAFKYCTGLTSVTIGNGVTRIRQSAFSQCYGLTSVTIGNSVTSIEQDAFWDCESLTSVTIPDSVTSIGDFAFCDCSGLTSVTIPNSVTNIGEGAFADCSGLTSITIGNSVTSIEEDAFWNCTSLTSVTIPDSVTRIGKDAFYNCDSLTDIYYGGTESQWGLIDFQEDWGTDATVHFGVKPTARVLEGVIREGTDWALRWKITYTELNGNRSAPELEIYMDGTDNKDTFKYCVPESSDDISPWLTESGFDRTEFVKLAVRGNSRNPLYIVDKQFRGYTKLRTVGLQYLDGIGAAAFAQCPALTEVILPNGFSHIANSVFEGCTGLRSVMLPSKLKTIGVSAFHDCKSLRSVSLPESLTKIDRSAFEGCSSLSGTIDIYGMETTIGEDAFKGCGDITLHVDIDSAALTYAKENGIPYKIRDTVTIEYRGYTARFSPLLFRESSTKPNPELAKFAGILSWEFENIDLDAETIDRPVYSELGIDREHYLCTGGDAGLLGKGFFTTVCSKQIRIDGKKTNLLIIVAKGTTTLIEGIGDVFTTANATFFTETRFKAYDIMKAYHDDIMNAVSYYLEKHPELERDPLKVLITGHSLGGAAANLVGADFTMFADDSAWWSDHVDKDDIFVYTFGALDSIKTDGTVSKGYENIHNITNFYDTFGPTNGRSAAGNSRYGKYGHIDQFAKSSNAILTFETHEMYTYLDAIVNGDVSYENKNQQKVASFECPVDVKIYRDGELVGQVKDNEVVDDVTTIPLVVADDRKYALLDDDGNYTFEMTGADDGTMTYRIADASTGEINCLFENVDLEPGKTMRSAVGPDIAADEVQLFVVNEAGNTVAEIAPDGTETAVHPADPIAETPSDQQTEPTTEPSTAPTTEPTTQPASVTTAPTSEPTTPPATEPTTEPTTLPTTLPTPTGNVFSFGGEGISAKESEKTLIYASGTALTKSELVSAMTVHFERAVITVEVGGFPVEDDAPLGTGARFYVYVSDADEIPVSKTIIFLGDVDGDATVNATDARLALRAAAKLDTLDGAFASAADTDGDNNINATDARGILRAAAKLDVLKVA